MSYSASIQYRRKQGGRVSVLIVEKEARDTSEAGPIRVPRNGRVVLTKCRRVSGTGTTVDPTAGRAPGWTASTPDEIMASSTTAPAAYVAERDVVPYNSPRGELWHRSGLNSTTPDGVIETEYEVIPGVG